VIVSDTDHLCGICGDRGWVWKSFTRGENPLFMDPYDGHATGRGAPAGYDPNNSTDVSLRLNLGYVQNYAQRMNLVTMTPTNNTSLCSTGYCLRHAVATGAEYLVYSPTGGGINVDLSAVSSSKVLNVEWFNPSTGTTVSGGTVNGGSVQSFTPPFSGDAVVYIYDAVTGTLARGSIGTQDGWVLESSETSNVGGSMDTTSNLLYVGDDAQDRQYRSYLTFNTAGLPDNAVITSLKLRIKVQGFVGGNMFIPTSTLGSLVMDIREPYFGVNANLAVADFQSAPSYNAVGVLGTISSTGWRTVTFKNTAYPYVNLKGKTQFRLRFQKDDNDDMSSDFIKMFSGNVTTVDYPKLIITYYYIP